LHHDEQPQYSTATGWHRDSRYWHFARAELISAWLAYDNETVENGCLLVIPGSHQLPIDASQLDTAQFLRTDLPQNQALLAQASPVALQQGDVLLFHSNLFHAAGKIRPRRANFLWCSLTGMRQMCRKQVLVRRVCLKFLCDIKSV
jgi:phytanoyl-CoA hydroxylase